MKRNSLSTLIFSALLVLGVASTQASESLGTSEYVESVAQWRVEREEELKGPDGWLNLAGLYWLGEGSNSMGSSPENDIVLADLPAAPRLGEFLVDGEDVVFRAEPGGEVFSDGEPVAELRLVHDEAGRPTVLTHGALAWHAIHRMGQMGVRLRDLNHPAVSAFPGIKSYPTDAAWRVAARFKADARIRDWRRTPVAGSLCRRPRVPADIRRPHHGQDNLSGGPLPVCVRSRTRGRHGRGLQQGHKPALRLHRLCHLPAPAAAQSPQDSHRSRRAIRQVISLGLAIT